MPADLPQHRSNTELQSLDKGNAHNGTIYLYFFFLPHILPGIKP